MLVYGRDGLRAVRRIILSLGPFQEKKWDGTEAVPPLIKPMPNAAVTRTDFSRASHVLSLDIWLRLLRRVS